MVAHDAGAFLREAVESVLGQTISDLELILVDNGSRDGSVAALRCAVSDPRIRIVALDSNLGPFGGAVAGLEACRAPFVARMDADDISEPDRLALQLAPLEADASLGGLGSHSRMIDADGCNLGHFGGPTAPDEIFEATRFGPALHHPTLTCRREVFHAVPYRTEFPVAGDHDFVARAVEHWRFAAVPRELYRYRVHSGTISRTRRALQVAFGNVARVTTARRRAGLPENLAAEVRAARKLADELGQAHLVNARAVVTFESEGWMDLAAWAAAEAMRQSLLAGDRRTTWALGRHALRSRPRAAPWVMALVAASLLPGPIREAVLALRWPLRRWKSRRLDRLASRRES